MAMHESKTNDRATDKNLDIRIIKPLFILQNRVSHKYVERPLKLTLFAVCAFEVTLILFVVAWAAKVF